EWAPGSIIYRVKNEPLHFAYAGTNFIGDSKLKVVQFHQELKKLVGTKLGGGWIFKPISFLGRNVDKDRVKAQRALFEASVVRPLILRAREKLINKTP